MHIINKYGIHHTVPDEWSLPVGARLATDTEVAAYEAEAAAKAAQPPATPALGPLELSSALAERDTEIGRLQAALTDAQKPQTGSAGKAKQ